MSKTPPDVRERTRLAVREQLANAAVGLFVVQGYEATTVEQIAEATGLSRRSFHRYFSGKEDVLTEWFSSIGRDIALALSQRPQEEPAWAALRRSFDLPVQGMEGNADAMIIARMMLTTPALHGHHLQKIAQWRQLFAQELVTRSLSSATPLSPLAASALTGSALACLESAQTQWISADDASGLADLVDEAMLAVAPLRP